MTSLTDSSARHDTQDKPPLSGSCRVRPRVLFVDDESHVLDGIRLALRTQRYEIRTATRPDVALDMQRDDPFDVIVADDCMPGMPGSELLTVIAREFPSVSRVMLTGQATVEAAARAINHAGVVRFLLKPCAPRDLQEAIEAALQVRSRSATVRSLPNRHWSASGHAARPATDILATSEARDLKSPIDAQERILRTASEVREAEYWQSALGKNELLLQAQKIVALDNPIAVFGYELLARVRMQAGPLLRLSEFVSSHRGPAHPASLDRWVIQHIVKIIHRRPRELSRSGLTILLNLSAQSANAVSFVHLMNSQLRSLGVAEQVLLQVPEEAAVASLSSDGSLLRSLCRSGFRLCIDGAGPDVKRLAALQQLPIGLIKIDADLIRSALASSRAEAAVRSVVEFARMAGIATAAKCVKTTSMAKQFRTLGIELGQGYAFGTPQSFEHVLASL